MPSEDTKILEFDQYQQSDKPPLIIYEDRECKMLIDVKIILRIGLQKNHVFQCLHLEA